MAIRENGLEGREECIHTCIYIYTSQIILSASVSSKECARCQHQLVDGRGNSLPLQ